MSKATLVYLKERPVDNESQSKKSNLQSHSSMEAVAADQKRTDPITLHPSEKIPSLSTDPDAGYPKYCNVLTEDQRGGTVGSPPDVTMRVSGKPSANSSIRGQAHTLAADHPVRGMPVVNSLKEHDASIPRNEVTELWIPQHFRIHKKLTRSHRRTVKEILGATFAHIYCTSRINPSLLRSSIDALQDVSLLVSRYDKNS